MSRGPALLRVAALSVDEVSQRGREVDDLNGTTTQAIELAAGGQLLRTDGQQARDAVIRYVSRMGGRATPFGLLAGTALVSQGARRDLELAERACHHVFVRLDAHVLELIVNGAGTDERTPELLQPGREPVDVAVELLRMRGSHREADKLSEVASGVCGIREVSAVSPSALALAWRALESTFPVVARVEQSKRFHLDLDFALVAAQVESELSKELDGTLRRLQLMFRVSDPLRRIKLAFRARYEDSEVRLSEVADFRNGLLETTFRVTSALANRAGVEREVHGERNLQTPQAAVQAFDHWITTGDPYDISAHPLARHARARSVQAALLDQSSSSHTALLLDGRGHAPLALFARFALSRPDREEALRDWIGYPGEQHTRRLEIVHSPGGRVTNILLRPRLNSDFIALNAGAGTSTRSLSEIGIRLVDGRFALRDLVTGQPVVMEVNSAQAADFAGNDPVYRLLAYIADAGRVRWLWGALDGLSHLPRVTCGRIIVTPEQWRVDQADIASVLRSERPGPSLRTLLPGVGERRWIGWGPDDRVLPLDLDDDNLVRAVLRRTRGMGRIKLTELPQVEHPAVAGPVGRHVGEIVIPLQTRDAQGASRQQTWLAVPDWGEAWVYAKYYCSVANADRVILAVGALATRQREEQISSEWFFVRYSDDGNHVRIRVRPEEKQFRTVVLDALIGLGRRLAAEGLITRTVVDRYVPEIARYGGPPALRRAESLFAADSAAIAALLLDRPDDEQRLLRGVGDIMAWTEIFYEANPSSALSALRHGRSDAREPPERGGKYGDFFRKRRFAIEAYVETHQADAATLLRLADLRAALTEHSGSGKFDSVFQAVLHMHFNRLFTIDPRRLESLAREMAIRRLLELRARRCNIES